MELVGGKKKFTGEAGLKSTQAYTLAFTQAVLDSFVDFRLQHVQTIDDSSDDEPVECDPTIWDCADLVSVARFLRQD